MDSTGSEYPAGSANEELRSLYCKSPDHLLPKHIADKRGTCVGIGPAATWSDANLLGGSFLARKYELQACNCVAGPNGYDQRVGAYHSVELKGRKPGRDLTVGLPAGSLLVKDEPKHRVA